MPLLIGLRKMQMVRFMISSIRCLEKWGNQSSIRLKDIVWSFSMKFLDLAYAILLLKNQAKTKRIWISQRERVSTEACTRNKNKWCFLAITEIHIGNLQTILWTIKRIWKILCSNWALLMMTKNALKKNFSCYFHSLFWHLTKGRTGFRILLPKTSKILVK